MRTFKTLIVLLFVIHHVIGLDLPPEFKKCKRAELDQCLKGAIQDALPRLKKGIPELNFNSLEPLTVPSITIGEGTGPVNLVQNFKNFSIYGITDAIVNKAGIQFSDGAYTIKTDMFIKEIRIEADYDFNGRILLFPIKGTGKCVILFKNATTSFELYGDDIIKKGIVYGDIKKVKMDLQPEKIEFKFDNFFDGDERLGNEINKLFNDNWKDIWEDIKRNYEEALEIIVQDVSNRIIRKVPHSVLFPED